MGKKKKQVKMEHKEEGEGPKWVTHYSSDHQILLVGDGDFSFSLSLAKAFGAASNIVASSLDSYDVVTKRYKFAKSNLDELQKLGACLLHEVDATKMQLHSDLKMRKFDRVIFNFPHAGFHGKEDDKLIIKKHKDLVLGFFKNANCMLLANGEVHVSHKTSAPFSNWNIEELASQCFLTLSECAEFKKEDYTGYNNKRGDSTRCDEPFPLGMCGTFKFVYNPKAISEHKRRKQVLDSRQQTNIPFQETRYYMEQSPTSIYQSHPQRSGIPIMNQAHTSFHLNHYPQPSFIPKMNGALSSLHLNHYPQTSYIPNMNEAPTSLNLNHYPQVLDSRQQTNIPFQETQYYMEQSPTSIYQSHPQRSGIPIMNQAHTSFHLNHYPQPSFIPKMNGALSSLHLNHYPQTSYIPNMNEAPTSLNLNHCPQACHIPKEAVTSTFGWENEYPPISRGYLNNVEELHRRATPPSSYYSSSCMSRGSYRSLQPMESLHSWQPWSTSTNVRYFPTDYDEGYKVYCGCSNYLQEAVDSITAQRVCYSFERRYIGARNEGYKFYEGSSSYLQEAHGSRTMGNFPSSHGARNDGFIFYDGSSNYLQEAHGSRRAVDSFPSSHVARNESYKIYDGSSNYFEEAHGNREAQRGYCSFERYFDEVPGRTTLNGEKERKQKTKKTKETKETKETKKTKKQKNKKTKAKTKTVNESECAIEEL